MRFLHPYILFLLLPLLVVALFLVWRMSRQRKELKKFGETELCPLFLLQVKFLCQLQILSTLSWVVPPLLLLNVAEYQ